MGNTTIVVTQNTFAKLNKAKYEFLAGLADDGMTPRISNDVFISQLVDCFIKNGRTGK